MYRVSIVRKSLAIYAILRLINDFFCKKPPKNPETLFMTAHMQCIYLYRTYRGTTS